MRTRSRRPRIRSRRRIGWDIEDIEIEPGEYGWN